MATGISSAANFTSSGWIPGNRSGPPIFGAQTMLENLGWLLHRCTKTKAARHGISVHAAAIKIGVQSEVVIGNHILNFYAKCGSIDSARHMFHEMPHRNLVSWSAMISGYDQSNRPSLALQLFSAMQERFKPNEFVLASALSSCTDVKDLILGRQIHAQVLKSGHGFVNFVFNSLILTYMKCGMHIDALLIFADSECDSVNLVSYNIAIAGLVENNLQEKGIKMFRLLLRHGIVPDHFTFAGLLGNGELLRDLPVVMELHCLTVKLGLDCVAYCGNVLMMVYSKFDLLEESERVFRSIVNKDAVSWNTAIAACCQCGKKSKAVGIFREMMVGNGLSPDDYTYASLVSAAAGEASMRHGKEIHCHLIRTRLSWDVGVGNALVNLYGKSGSIRSACVIFEQMGIHNLVSWNSILAALAHHGLAERTFALFEEMLRSGMEPDSVTFLQLLTACSHCGLADEGLKIFNSMKEVYRITQGVEHLCCLVDLLGRSGRVLEALEYTHRYSLSDDPVILGSLLSACRLHRGGVATGEQVAQWLLELQPATTSPYVLLSNLYALDSKWDDVAEARKLLQATGLKKEAAYSLIEVKGSMEKFMVGDFSHSRMDDILNLLQTLTQMLCARPDQSTSIQIGCA